MARQLWQSTRVQVFGGGWPSKRAYALIGFEKWRNDSTITLIRGTDKEIPILLRRFGDFSKDDLEMISKLNFKETYWADDCSMITRIA